MRARSFAFAVGGLVAGVPAQAPAPLAVAVEAQPASPWQRAPVTLTVRVVCDRAWLRDAAVPLLQRALDLPFQIELPWLAAPTDAVLAPSIALLPPPDGAVTRRVALGDRIVPMVEEADRTVDGRACLVVALRVRWTSPQSGTCELPPVTVRYAEATRFEDSLLGGRQPVDRREARVASAPVTLTVRELPPPPPAFTGAVGVFAVASQVEPDHVAVGESARLTVTVRGEGDLAAFDGLRVPPLAGFHVQGVVDRNAPGVRTFVVDLLALRDGATEVPAFPLPAFDPERGEYVAFSAGGCALRVTPANGDLPPAVRELVRADEQQRPQPLPRWPYAVGAAALLALLGTWRAAAGGRRRAVTARFAALRAQLAAAGPADAERTLGAFDAALAALAGEPSPAGEATVLRLAARGVPGDVVAGLRAVRQQLDAARFGGVRPTAEVVFVPLETARRALGA